jgi:allophanate hydrolase
VSAVQVFRATYQQEVLRKKTSEVWQRIDAMVVPTVPTIFTPAYACEHPNEVNAALGSNLAYVNLLDLSSVTVPVGFRTDGIPGSMTLVAPAFCDWELCRLAKMIAGEALSIKNQKLPQHAEQSDILLVVTGTHMGGGTMNHELVNRRATFRESVETAPDYALYALDTDPRKPGLINVGSMMGVAIEAEIWALAPEAFANLVANIVAPMCVGNVRLKDGRIVKGFLCEEYATRRATPISAFGGWRGFLTSLGQA